GHGVERGAGGIDRLERVVGLGDGLQVGPGLAHGAAYGLGADLLGVVSGGGDGDHALVELVQVGQVAAQPGRGDGVGDAERGDGLAVAVEAGHGVEGVFVACVGEVAAGEDLGGVLDGG